MSDKLEIVKPATAEKALEKSAERFVAYHDGCIGGFKQQMGYAFLAGMELINIKACLPHGEFQKFWKKHFSSIEERSGQRYMKFCEAVKATGAIKYDTMSDLKLLPSGELSDSDKEKVSAAVYKLADGKSLTEMYRDLGVIRQKKPDGGFRPNAGAVQEWLKAHHPELAGTKYDELPAQIQRAFKKQYGNRKRTAAELAGDAWVRWTSSLDLHTESHDQADFKQGAVVSEDAHKHWQRAYDFYGHAREELKKLLDKAKGGKCTN